VIFNFLGSVTSIQRTLQATATLAVLKRVRKIAENNFKLCHVCLYVRLSIRMEQLGSQWTDFNEIWYLKIYRKLNFHYHLTRITSTFREALGIGCLW